MELPSDLAELASLRVQLLDLGYSRSKVAGCLEWVLGKIRGQELPMPAGSKSAYRKMLVAAYGGNGPRGEGPDETGSAPIAALAAVTGIVGVVAAAASGHPAALLAAAPIIPDSVNDEIEALEGSEYRWEPTALLAA